jgi:hypothetical protein
MKKNPEDRLIEEFHNQACAFVDLVYEAMGRPSVRTLSKESQLSETTVRRLLSHDFKRPQLMSFQKLAYSAGIPLRLPEMAAWNIDIRKVGRAA